MRAPIVCLLLSLTLQSAPASAPPARAHHSIVYDAVARRLLVLGGSTSNDGGQTYVTLDDAWSYDGRQWRATAATGAQRSGMAVAFDSKRRRVVAFGGYCACRPADGGRFSDLIELRAGTWTKIAEIPTRPSTDSKMVYDTRRDRLVLFGGFGTGNQRNDDTWEFDGASWRRVEGGGPPGRADFAMTYDERRGRTVVFGGAGNGGVLGDTWEFDGAAWTQVAAVGPSARLSVSAVYDSRRARVVVYGNGDDTWTWNGAVWTKIADAGPTRRYMGALAYDIARDRVVLFGGRPGLPKPDANDTWEFDGTRWTQIAATR